MLAWEITCALSVKRLSLQLQNWNSTRGSTLERNLTCVHTATRDSIIQEPWKDMRRSTLERNLTHVISVGRVSDIKITLRCTWEFIRERNHITALHAGRVSVNHLIYTSILKKFTVNRLSSDPAFSDLTPHPHQTWHNNVLIYTFESVWISPNQHNNWQE